MAASAQPVNEAHIANIIRSLYQDAEQGINTDFTIIVAGTKLTAHKSVLAANSTFFESIIKTKASETILDRKIVNDGDLQVLKSVLKFMYLGYIGFNPDTVHRLLAVAEFLKLDTLKVSCESYMIETLDDANCIGRWKRAQKEGLSALECQAHERMCTNFEAISKGSEFLEMSVDDVKDVLSEDELNVLSEDPVLKAALRWINNSKDINCKKDVFSVIRLTFCDKNQLYSLSKDKKLPEDIRLALCSYLLHGEGPYSQPRRFFPGGITELTVVIGGSGKENNFNEIMWSKEGQNGNWDELAKSSHQTWLCNYSVCSSDESLLVSGGENYVSDSSVTSVNRFHFATKKWISHPDLPFPRQNHSSVSKNGKLYILGGQTSVNGKVITFHKEVDILDIIEGQWVSGAPLPVTLQFAAAVEVDLNIVVACGMLGEEASNEIYKYSILCDSWLKCADMPFWTDVASNSTVAVDGKVYLVGYDKFFSYDVQSDVWSKLVAPPRPSRWVSMIHQNGCLVIMGGCDADDLQAKNPHCDSQTYDLENKVWKIQKKTIPQALNHHAAFVLKIVNK